MIERDHSRGSDRLRYETIMASLAEGFLDHGYASAFWAQWRDQCASLAKASFGPGTLCTADIPPFGSISFPFKQLGAVATTELLAVDEMILLAFYARNRGRYKRVLDLGANVGLHSVALARCGFEVRAFEPDPVHIEALTNTLRLNDVSVDVRQAAISDRSGEAEFVRVCGNTTGSHIAGSKSAPYGELERFKVRVEAAEPHLLWCDFAKIDIEGHEGKVLTGTAPDVWQSADAMLEIGSAENAEIIHDWARSSGVALFSQKTGWRQVAALKDLPVSHREGSVFLTGKTSIPWLE
jgi:FkbM family methyltransferase